MGERRTQPKIYRGRGELFPPHTARSRLPLLGDDLLPLRQSAATQVSATPVGTPGEGPGEAPAASPRISFMDVPAEADVAGRAYCGERGRLLAGDVAQALDLVPPVGAEIDCRLLFLLVWAAVKLPLSAALVGGYSRSVLVTPRISIFPGDSSRAAVA